MSKFDVQRAWDRAINSLDHLGIQRDVFDAIETIKALEARIAKLERVKDAAQALRSAVQLKGTNQFPAAWFSEFQAVASALAACDDGEGT